jgi:hypothetical protein
MPEDLQKITFATSEHEDMPAERIPSQHLLNLQRETVHAAAHVGAAGGEPDPAA